MSEVNLTSKNYSEEVEKSTIPVLIDFWATWCGPCRAMMPVVAKIADENEGKIKVCKVNVDEEPDLAEKFGVMSIPTFVAIKNGEVLGTSIGVQDEEELLKIFNKYTHKRNRGHCPRFLSNSLIFPP